MADKHHSAKGNAEEAGALKEAVAELSGSFNGQFQKLTESIKKCSSKGAEALSHKVEAHPLKAVGISAGCGLLIGFLLARK